MKYWKHYCALMRKAERRGDISGYAERHHVFPKSIFGDNDRLVVLTAKEHYIAHVLLEKMMRKRYGDKHPYTYKMLNAIMRMSNDKSERRYVSSRLYETMRVRWAKAKSDSQKGNVAAWTQDEEWRKRVGEKISKRIKGKPSKLKGRKLPPRSPEQCAAISKAMTGKKHKQEVIQRMREYAIMNKVENNFGDVAWSKGSKWWNNGKENIRSVESPGEGYVQGRLPFKHKKKRKRRKKTTPVEISG